MFALTATSLVAVYLLGPALVVRLVLGFFVSVRTVVRSRSEEIAWSVAVALVPLVLAVVWAVKRGAILWPDRKSDIKVYLSCAYSESYFKDHQDSFFKACGSLALMNLSLIWRVYLMVFSFALILLVLAKLYGRIIRWRWINRVPGVRSVLDALVLTRVSEWYQQLSNITLPPKAYLVVDVLTTRGVMYSGQLASNIIGQDGKLTALILKNPRTFDHATYTRLKDARLDPKKEDFWKDIYPSQNFLINGSDISTVNSRHAVPADQAIVDDLQSLITGRTPDRPKSYFRRLSVLLKRLWREARTTPY